MTHLVSPIKPEKTNTCWAYAATIMGSWRRQQSLSVEHVMDQMGPTWRAKFDAIQGLHKTEHSALAMSLGMEEARPTSWTRDEWARHLDRSPLMVVTGTPDHVAVYTGISPDRRSIIRVDMDHGRFEPVPFEEFEHQFQTSEVGRQKRYPWQKTQVFRFPDDKLRL